MGRRECVRGGGSVSGEEGVCEGRRECLQIWWEISTTNIFPLLVQEGLTPLMVAVTNSNLELVGLLLSHGADVNCSRVCYRRRVGPSLMYTSSMIPHYINCFRYYCASDRKCLYALIIF